MNMSDKWDELLSVNERRKKKKNNKYMKMETKEFYDWLIKNM